MSAFISLEVAITDEDSPEIVVSSSSQPRISSIIFPDSSETSIIVAVKFSCALDTSEAIPAVASADSLITSTADETDVLICSTVATFASRIKSMALTLITASIVFVAARSNSLRPFISRR